MGWLSKTDRIQIIMFAGELIFIVTIASLTKICMLSVEVTDTHQCSDQPSPNL